MISRIIVAAVLALPMIASAAPTDGGVNQCNVGQVSCCNQLQQIPGSTFSALTGGLLGILPANILPFVGLGCTPLAALGVSGNNCNAQPACCTNNNFNALIGGLNCSPINVSL